MYLIRGKIIIVHLVYCYIDLRDDIIKYVGITSRKLSQRVSEHLKNEPWVSLSKWKILYFQVNTKSESESWESHLIAKYETYRWYNTAKKDWGLIYAFNDKYPKWNIYSIEDIVVDLDYTKYQVLDDIGGTNLITETELLSELDIDKDILLIMIAKKVIQPLAITSSQRLLFWGDSLERGRQYLKYES